MKLSKPIILSLAFATFIGVANAEQSKVDLSSEKAKLGYTIGAQIAADLLRGGLKDEIELEAFLAAQSDIMSGEEARMSPEDMQASQQAFQLKQQQAYAAVLAENKAKGDAFLAENKSKKDVKTTESGLQYEVLREGKGDQPTAESTVNVHYKGMLIDGTIFDSSYDRNQATDFPVGGVIPGFSEGLMLMKAGAQYRFTIPSELAYGEQGPASIGPNQVLIFEVELNEVK